MLKESQASFGGQILKGVIIALLITLVSVLIFALILSLASLSDKIIKPINQFIKLISVFFGCFLSVRNSRFILKGGLIGLLSALLSGLLFALIAGSGLTFLTLLIDLIFATVMGAISGAITLKLVGAQN